MFNTRPDSGSQDKTMLRSKSNELVEEDDGGGDDDDDVDDTDEHLEASGGARSESSLVLSECATSAELSKTKSTSSSLSSGPALQAHPDPSDLDQRRRRQEAHSPQSPSSPNQSQQSLLHHKLASLLRLGGLGLSSQQHHTPLSTTAGSSSDSTGATTAATNTPQKSGSHFGAQHFEGQFFYFL